MTNRILSIAGMLILSIKMPLSAMAEPPIRIMPLGDSITVGNWGLPIQGGYRTKLYEALTAAGFNVDFVGTFSDTDSGPPDANHQGQGGARIDQIQANIGTWLNLVEDPDVVLLLIGTNDFWQNYQISTIKTRLTNLIADIATRRPYAKIIVSNLPLRTDSVDIETRQSEFNAAIPGIVAEQVSLGRQVTWVDMHSALTPFDLMIDGVHPSTSGYDKMADAWLPAITGVISPQGTSNPPEIARIGPMVDLSHVSVVFSKPVADDAVILSNYTISGGLTVIGAELDAITKRTITLTTSPQTPGTGYSLQVSGVRDRTAQQTLIAPGSMVSFSPNVISNGSFEYDYAGWTHVGNQEILSTPTYIASDGAKMVVFNSGQLAPGATLSQTFSTTAGQVYRLVFDLGVISYKASEQRLQVDIQGVENLAAGTEVLTGVGGGAIVWMPITYFFTADSATATVTFTDASSTSQNIDMLLDNIRVDSGVVEPPLLPIPPMLTNGSFETGNLISFTPFPRHQLNAWTVSGVPFGFPEISICRATDGSRMALFNGGNDIYEGTISQTFTTEIGRTYQLDFEVGIIAAAGKAPRQQILGIEVNSGGLLISEDVALTAVEGAAQWTAKSYQFTATDSSTTLTFIDKSGTLSGGVAGDCDLLLDHVRVSLPPILSNGSFEVGELISSSPFSKYQLTGWETSSAPFGFVETSVCPTTDGSRMALFNGGGDIYGGTISQTFTTVVGKNYQLDMDVGIITATRTAPRQQLLGVELNSGGILISDDVALTAIEGASQWKTRSYSFVATSTSATLTFTDKSGDLSHGSAHDCDLLIDHVRITADIGVNGAPLADDDSYSTDEDMALVVAAPGVLAGDSDPEGASLTAVVVTQPAHGTVVLNENGGFIYTPAANFYGSDSFTYMADDSVQHSAPATVFITVNPKEKFNQWLAGFSLLSGPSNDSDGDLISNAVEYVIGGNPVDPSDLNLLPTVSLSDPNITSENYMLFTYNRTDLAKMDPSTVILVTWSTDLMGPWTNAAGTEGVVIQEIETADPSVDHVKVFIPRALAPDGRLFARLEVTVIIP